MKKSIALIAMFLLSLPTLLLAQNQGTYIENLGAQDSSYMEETMAPAEQASGSNGAFIIVIVVVVIAAVAFFLLRKRKK